MRRIVPLFAAAVLLGLLVPPAYGNPVVVYSPNRVVVGIGFFDVVLIEAIVLAWLLQKRFLAGLGAAALANFLSTIPGLVIFSHSFDDVAGLLLAGQGRGFLLQQILVSFMLSVFIEYFILRILWRNSPRQVVMYATLAANIVSYVLITPVLFLATPILVGRW